MLQEANNQRVVVVSAPSGTGKTTLNRRLIGDYPDLVEMSVSHTTRTARPGEVEGIHYHFVDKATFERKIAKGDFLEWALVHGHLYGTSRAELTRIGARGHVPLLEIDVQGWLNAREQIPNATSIFILPPTMRDLWERLKFRGSDPIQTRWLRLQNAYHEIEKADHYTYFIVNDDLDVAYLRLKSIVIDGRPGDIDAVNGIELCNKLKEEFHKAGWIKELEEEIFEMSRDG